MIFAKILSSQTLVNPFKSKSDFIDFTQSNDRRFYSSKGEPLGVKGLNQINTLPNFL